MKHHTVTTPRAAYFVTDDPAAALEHFRPQAEAIAEGDAPPLRVDIDLARYNIEVALASFEPHRATLPDRLLDVDVASLWELPALWKATKLAATAVPKSVSTGEIDATFRELTPLREAALLYLESAALLGVVPTGRVQAIREGRGILDHANDCVAIVHVFREHHEALAGRHLFSDAQLETLWRKGSWLVDNITPKGAPRTRSRTSEGLLRDRLGKMLIDRYERLRALGGVLFGVKTLDAKVPPLFSRVRDAGVEEEIDKPVEKPADAPTEVKAEVKAEGGAS